MITQLRDADLHLLRVFVAVAESGGFAAAQDRLNVASSTISTQISNLETRLGFRLCERGRSGFSLTSRGEVVLQATYQLMYDIGHFTKTIEATGDNLVGSVRLTLIDNTIMHPNSRIDKALQIVKERHPFLHLEMRQRSPERIENALIKREVDLGISWFSSQMPSLDYTTLFEEEHAIFCGADHPLAQLPETEIAPEQLESADWVSRSYELPRSFHFARPPISTAVSDNMEGIAHFVLANTHIGYLPLHFAKPWVDSGCMKMILPDRYNYSLKMQLATRADADSDQKAAAVKAVMLECHNKG